MPNEMAPNKVAANLPLQTLTERMRRQYEHAAAAEPVIVEDVVAAVLDTMGGRLSSSESRLLQEVAGLGRIIKEAKAGIAEVSLDDIRGNHIPVATDELGAIVLHTAAATDSILESCEMLDRLAATLDGVAAGVLQAATTQIYEACSFQDITGQRITKVVKALQAIEAKVLALSDAYATPGAWDLASARPRPAASRSEALRSEALRSEPEADPLLNGPMLPHAAMSQDDIDSLLADFG